MAGEWLVRLANFENFKHCVVVEFHIRVGESYYCSSCALLFDNIVKFNKHFFLRNRHTIFSLLNIQVFKVSL